MRIKRIASALAVSAGVLFIGATAAGAQVAPDGNASPDTPVSAVFTVNNTLVTLLTGVLIPLVVGLLTREDNPAWVKIGLAGAVSTVANLFLQQIQDDGTAVVSQEFWVQVAVIFAISLGTYLGIYKPVAAERGKTVSDIGSRNFGLIPVTKPAHHPPAA